MFRTKTIQLFQKLKWAKGNKGKAAEEGKKSYMRLPRKGKQEVRENFHQRQRDQKVLHSVKLNQVDRSKGISRQMKNYDDVAWELSGRKGKHTTSEDLAAARHMFAMKETLRKTKSRTKMDYLQEYRNRW